MLSFFVDESLIQFAVWLEKEKTINIIKRKTNDERQCKEKTINLFNINIYNVAYIIFAEKFTLSTTTDLFLYATFFHFSLSGLLSPFFTV